MAERPLRLSPSIAVTVIGEKKKKKKKKKRREKQEEWKKRLLQEGPHCLAV